MTIGTEIPVRRRRFRKRWVLWTLLLLASGVGSWHVIKPMPAGTALSSGPMEVDERSIQFLTDLTFTDMRGVSLHEQQIFAAVWSIIAESESFIIADFFLFNDLMGAANDVHQPLSRQLADALIARKQARPGLSILLITDPINDVYGGANSVLFDELRGAGIDVVATDLNLLRDSNPLYSSLWRMFGQWWGNASGTGTLPHPFDASGERITLRSWLTLLNFKANHRKLIVADRRDGEWAALLTSANPHDASSAHSNVALRLSGALAKQIADNEQTLARISGWNGHIFISNPTATVIPAQDAARLTFLTESAIRTHLLEALDATRSGDAIRIAIFYISDRKVIDALLAAAARNVTVELILDPNKDAFGRQKDGIPNRPVANELVTRSMRKIQVRWYRTRGEQFHTKLALITRAGRLIASLGSANFTRRNLADYNLEANIAVEVDLDSQTAAEMLGYFQRLWSNRDSPLIEYTAPFGAYEDSSRVRYWRYRFMEASGLSTF